jgi:hypothetical protein
VASAAPAIATDNAHTTRDRKTSRVLMHPPT